MKCEVPLTWTHTFYSAVCGTVVELTTENRYDHLSSFCFSRRFPLKMFVASAGTLSASHRTNPVLLPRSLRGANGGVALMEVKHKHRNSAIISNTNNTNASALTRGMNQNEGGGRRKSVRNPKEGVEPTDRSEVRGVIIHEILLYMCMIYASKYKS